MIKDIELHNLEHPAENVFGLEQPEDYHCRVCDYRIGHSVLILRIYKKDRTKFSDSLYLIFEAVQFFEGPMWWQGANFCTSTLDEYVELILAVQRDEVPEGLIKDLVDQLQSQKSPSCLFTLRISDKIQVRILASMATLN